MKDIVYGAPHWQQVTCKSCGEKWSRYFHGSHDWQYKDCFNCEAKQTTEKIKSQAAKGSSAEGE